MKQKTRVAATATASRGSSQRKQGFRHAEPSDDLADDLATDLTDDLTQDPVDPEVELDIESDIHPETKPKGGLEGESNAALDDAPDITDAPGPIDLSLTPSSPAIRDSLQLYLREVNRFPMLKPDEEFTLIRQYREQNDTKAAFRLISSHLRLVVRIAMDFQRSWMQNILDLIQEGNVGLMKALQKFDPERGIKFSYYASFWIKAYILKFIMDNWRMVKVGTTQTQRKLFYNLGKERQRLQNQGFDASTASLSKSLNVSEQDITEMDQRLGSSDMSLDAPFSEDTSMTRMDMLPALSTPVDDLLAEEEMVILLKSQIQKMIPALNDKERDVLEQRLMNEEPVTLREIGEKYNITRERVRQIEARLIDKIRDNFSHSLATATDKGTDDHVERT
ncbi:RNA polymerase sigma factor RpoD/SigA [Desulfonatronum sp. SC1]|uniref:sigma-70 family RNA polymerase sigma factor n=1 Tax=Desulfonatronum sp. SC1 TaxID=2109626 RepID=UPI000D315830|nr:RNA polymerase factor sigma-32 [Desulfonatronum sp. SC1]PTN38247.1 RNA polymerase subunit sigma-70 [Desulfonatronum sp. SC1]